MNKRVEKAREDYLNSRGLAPGIGIILLGMPKGFNRLSITSDSPQELEYDTLDEYLTEEAPGGDLEFFTIPLQKFLTPEKHTDIVYLCPRINHIIRATIKENCIDRIDCPKLYIQDLLFGFIGKNENEIEVKIHETFPTYERGARFAWKYLNENGHTFIRGLDFRRQKIFLHIILEDCMKDFNCKEVTEERTKNMD